VASGGESFDCVGRFVVAPTDLAVLINPCASLNVSWEIGDVDRRSLR
jgi:hypothetical protein